MSSNTIIIVLNIMCNFLCNHVLWVFIKYKPFFLACRRSRSDQHKNIGLRGQNKFRPNLWVFLDRISSFDSPITMKCVPYCFSRSSFKFQGHIWQKSTQMKRFWTVTPVWIHWWPLNDAQSLACHSECALLFFGVIHQISRSRGQQIAILIPIGRFWTVT